MAAIKKVKKIIANNLILRNACLEDAGFILSLRLNSNKNKYLHAVSPDIQAQRDYMVAYEKSNDFVYFIVQDLTGRNIGTVRIYDAKGESFCWGSWILIDDKPPKAAMECATIIYTFAHEYLGFKMVHFDVRNDNARLHRFHQQFGAEKVSQNDLDTYYIIPEHALKEAIKRHSIYLPNGLTIEE